MENRKRRVTFANIRDRWIESLIILACIVIPVLDFFGVFDEVPIFQGKIANFTLFLLAILTGYVAFTQPEKQESFHERLSDGINKIFDSLSNSSTVVLKARPFTNISLAIEYARKQIAQAKQQIVVIYPELISDFFQAVPPRVFYKQIFIVQPEKLLSYQRVLPGSLVRMPVNYSYAGLRCSKELLQSFVIIDDRELIILSESMPIATRNPQFIKVYRESFNSVWDRAIKLKINDIVHSDRVQFILTPPQRPPEIPADLEECVKNCLKAHERLKNRAN